MLSILTSLNVSIYLFTKSDRELITETPGNGETDNPDYGGAYVYNTGKGCVLISLYAINS